jgi:hypothetical protein
MKRNGSVLIVVLGLLAILAVVGITFVTMSSIDTSTAANFALQAQFDLAADAAVDYVCQALVQDIWEFDTSTSSSTYRQYTGRVLTGLYGTEFWDHPSATDASGNRTDPYLATNWEGFDKPTPTGGAVYSFPTAAVVTLFNLTNFGGATVTDGSGDTDGHPNNLGIPSPKDVGQGVQVKWNSPANGLWIPDLAFPYETGVIRVSVTVQDHGAMVNLNAHGNGNRQDNEVAQRWPYVAAQGKGYFVSDVGNPLVVPSFWTGFNLDLKKLVLGDGASVPGRWSKSGPGIQATGEILIQNPFAKGDRPYTLDEEFELRRLTGTAATTRLESFTTGGGLQSTPASFTPTTWQNRLSLTTVGWTAEVRPSLIDPLNTSPPPGTHDTTQQLKADLNFDIDADIKAALVAGRAFDPRPGFSEKTLDQFIANICAFRKRTPSFLQPSPNIYGARRQPFFTKAAAGSTPGTPPKWPLKLEVYNPWPGDQAGDTGGIAWNLWKIVITCKDDQTIGDASDKKTITIVIREITTPPSKWAAKRAIEVNKTISTDPADTTRQTLTIAGTGANNTFGLEVAEIRLDAFSGGPPQGVDKIDPSVVSAGWRRKVGVYEEMRAPSADLSTAITVLYVKDLASGEGVGNLSFGTLNPQEILKGDGIPIRFPHSVPDIATWDPKTKGPLPPYATATDSQFKAFLRIGDLNQVLCPKDETEALPANYWPWIGRIASKSVLYQTLEKEVKFDWDDTMAVGDPTAFCRRNAANVLTTERPWLDSYDNDGDGKIDDQDKGNDTDGGRFCGPEIRVAGKINLNTATDKTLDAIDTSLGTGGAIKTVVKNLRVAGTIKSIAQLVGQFPSPGTGDDALGPLEKRDLPFTRISNIATVRSDTFSIYGTVQYVEPPKTAGATPARIIKTRRFWALVDRSPSLAFSPAATGNKFLHPRIVNLQWMD